MLEEKFLSAVCQHYRHICSRLNVTLQLWPCWVWSTFAFLRDNSMIAWTQRANVISGAVNNCHAEPSHSALPRFVPQSFISKCLPLSLVHFLLPQLNELVVGDTSGKLFVYKNDDSKPWITRTCVGMVSWSSRLKNSLSIYGALFTDKIVWWTKSQPWWSMSLFLLS